MSVLRSALVAVLALAGGAAVAQRQLDVRQCLEIALENNLTLREQMLRLQESAVNLQQAKLAFWPSLTASLDWRMNLGTAFDFVTFQRVNEATQFSNPQLAANAVLFGGLARHYALRRTRASLQASKHGLQRSIDDISTNLVALYLQLVFDRSNLAITRDRIGLLEAQLERSQRLLSAGASTELAVRNLQSQIALENVTAVTQQNLVDRDELALVQLLQLPATEEYVFLDPDSLPAQQLLQPLPEREELLLYSLQNLPEVLEAEQNIEVARWTTQEARSALWPTLSFSGAVSSTYSSNGGQAVYDTIEVAPGIRFPQAVGLERTGYFEQVQDNFSQFIGITLSVPIFNNGRVRQQVELARINEARATLLKQGVEDQLRSEIETAHLDARGAQLRYRALSEQADVLQETFRLTQVQFDLGAASFYTYLDALNTFTAVRNQLQQAAYDLLFKRKILDFYAGKPLDL